MPATSHTLTDLLQAWGKGDAAAEERGVDLLELDEALIRLAAHEVGSDT